MHRKGATRAFPPDHPEVPDSVSHDRPAGDHSRRHGPRQLGAGRAAGQHGADVRHRLPRRRPRDEPHRRRSSTPQGRRIDKELAAHGVIARARSWKGLAEEQPDAYKDVDLVVEVVHRADLARKVARMRPIGVIKG